jgi:AcrR family transcriptional regulator
MTISPTRQRAMEALLDAAEALLIDVGYAGVTTRRLAERAGVNHGLVHYYFGSMEEVLLQTMERFTQRLIERQRAMYGTEEPFLDKWRTAMGYLREDIAAGYPKVWYELQAMSWNRPEFRERVLKVNAEWRAVLTDAFENAMRIYGIDRRRFPVEAIVSLVMTFNLGLQLEQLIGVDEGHVELLAMIDRWLSSLETDQARRRWSER